MMSFHSTISNLDEGAVKQYRDGNSRYWHSKALDIFTAQGRGGFKELDRLALENEDYTWRDIVQELARLAKEN
jgi:hypothetical protein